MRFVTNYKEKLRNRNLLDIDKIHESLAESRNDMLSLKYFVDSRKIPKAFIGTTAERKLIKHKNQVSSEIENWLLFDAEISIFFEDYKSKKISIRSLITFVAFARRNYSIRKLGKLGKEIERTSKEINKQKTPINFETRKSLRHIKLLPSALWLKIVIFLYSSKTVREVFEPIVADWQEEYFEALFKKEIWKARWINVRYTYAFLAAMWQKSPIGDLIEFISKFAK